MPRYVTLINWTDQGAKNFKDTVDRYEQAGEVLAGVGASWVDVYWTSGPYDIVAIIEAPNGEAATAGLLKAAGEGNIRTMTMRGFTAAEMRSVIEKAG